MPQPVTITLRDQTTGRISDLLTDEGRPSAQCQNLLAYLAGALVNYKEEGIEFTPSVVFCDNIQEVLKTFPGALSHTVGTAPLDPSSGPMVLKHCAPLSGRNWFIFMERAANDTMNYGVFTYFRLPTAIPLHEAITIDPNQFCILVRKTSPNTIEIRGAKGSLLILIFSTTREATQSITPIEKFSLACCCGIGEETTRKVFNAYLARVIEEALTLSHGTILICGRDLDLGAIPEMQDAVPVSPSLDFQSAFLEFQTANTAGSILGLQRCEELLHGFLRCDGMIAFDTSGRITAYRVFFRPVAASAASQVAGGARRRAFEGVKGLVGKQLLSALFRSQDGLTLEHGVQ